MVDLSLYPQELKREKPIVQWWHNSSSSLSTGGYVNRIFIWDWGLRNGSSIVGLNNTKAQNRFAQMLHFELNKGKYLGD